MHDITHKQNPLDDFFLFWGGGGGGGGVFSLFTKTIH